MRTYIICSVLAALVLAVISYEFWFDAALGLETQRRNVVLNVESSQMVVVLAGRSMVQDSETLISVILNTSRLAELSANEVRCLLTFDRVDTRGRHVHLDGGKCTVFANQQKLEALAVELLHDIRDPYGYAMDKKEIDLVLKGGYSESDGTEHAFVDIDPRFDMPDAVHPFFPYVIAGFNMWDWSEGTWREPVRAAGVSEGHRQLNLRCASGGLVDTVEILGWPTEWKYEYDRGGEASIIIALSPYSIKGYSGSYTELKLYFKTEPIAVLPTDSHLYSMVAAKISLALAILLGVLSLLIGIPSSIQSLSQRWG